MIDKSAFDIIGAYYTKPAQGSGFEPGRICEAPVFFLPPVLQTLKFDIDAANRGETVKFDIGPVNDKTFNHRPVTKPRLDQHEAFVVVRAKRRPVVILSSPITFPGTPAGIHQKDFPEVFLVCPLFTFHDTHSQEFRLRIEAWEYNMLFYAPRNDEFLVEEGFLRFDLSQVVPKGQLRLRPVRLTDDAFLALRYCYSWFLTGTLDPTLAKYRETLLEALSRPAP